MEQRPLMTPEIKDQTHIILDSIADGVFTVDSDFRITSFNQAAEKITGITREEAIGKPCWVVLRASICEKGCALQRTMETGDSIINQSIRIQSTKGRHIPVSISTALLRDESGKVIGGVETFRDLSVEEKLRRELNGQLSMFDILSKNREMQKLFEKVELVAGSDTTVLIEGESGTGKELFARAIHLKSGRRHGPMVIVNCGALPDSLLESELFGYKAGAFTDAKKDKPGRLALARGGTLFLDEIGDVSPMLQVRLLRVLQDRIFEPLGGIAPEKADVRILAATHRNLDEMVASGEFRQDLFYRINVVRLEIPPLRHRREDILLLIEHFLGKFAALHRPEARRFSPEALALLMAHDFPGNVRELENIIEHAIVVSTGPVIELEALPKSLRQVGYESGKIAHGNAPQLNEMERAAVLAALKAHQWNRSAAAAHLQIHPTTLWRKMRRHHIVVPPGTRRSKSKP